MKKYIDLYFTTSTIRFWYPIFRSDANKDVVIDAFRFVVKNKRALILGFVIMDTHIHLVWQILAPYKLSDVQRDMLKFISQTLKNRLVKQHELEILRRFIVRRSDRHIQMWMRNSRNFEIFYENVLQQKLNYVHKNLEKKGLSDVEYKYSSASYYVTGMRNWDFL